MSVQGLKEITRAINQHKIKTIKGLRRGLHEGARYLLRQSNQLVPVGDTGLLKASGRALLHGSGLQSEAWVSYGTEYAIYVHENLEAAHGAAFNAKYEAERKAAKTPAQKKRFAKKGDKQTAKFLEIPARDSSHRQQIKKLIRHGASGGLFR